MFLVRGSIENINRSIREATRVAHEDKEKELAAKNRVNISLKEYEALKKENETLKADNFSLNEVLQKFLKPFALTNVPESVIRDILDGKAQFETKMEICEDMVSLKTKLYVTYILDKDIRR